MIALMHGSSTAALVGFGIAFLVLILTTGRDR